MYVWTQFLILFSLVTLNYVYRSFDIDCFNLETDAIVNNLTICLIFIKHHIYDFSDCIGKIVFKVLFFYSNLHQCFLINVHFTLLFKLVSKLQFAGVFQHPFGKANFVFNKCIQDLFHFITIF